MNNNSQNEIEKQLAEVVSELRLMRKVLVFFALGAVIIVGLFVSAESTVPLLIIGIILYLVTLIASSIVRRGRRKRVQAARLRELSGR